MSNLLYNLAKLQSNKAIPPPIIDYDQSSKLLQVVDSTFYFFLKHADLAAISDELPNQLEEDDRQHIAMPRNKALNRTWNSAVQIAAVPFWHQPFPPRPNPAALFHAG